MAHEYLLRDHEDKYPFQLVEQFPHISAKIINLWGNAVALTEYFESLLSANKPHSHQLLPIVMHELYQLADLYKSMQDGGRLSHDMWESTNAHDAIQRNDTVRAKQCNPIFMVAKRGDIDSLDKLLKSGTDVDVRDDENKTALMIASFEGHEIFVQALIQKGAKISHRDNDGLTSLHWAVLGGHENIISMLVARGGISMQVIVFVQRLWSKLPQKVTLWSSSEYCNLKGE